MQGQYTSFLKLETYGGKAGSWRGGGVRDRPVEQVLREVEITAGGGVKAASRGDLRAIP